MATQGKFEADAFFTHEKDALAICADVEVTADTTDTWNDVTETLQVMVDFPKDGQGLDVETMTIDFNLFGKSIDVSDHLEPDAIRAIIESIKELL